MLLQTADSFVILVCHSWPARTKLHRWSRRLWRNTICSIWTAGTSPSCSSSPREEVGSQSHCPAAAVVRKTWKRVCSLVNLCSFVFQTCSYQTRPTCFMPCPRQQTLTLFCTRLPKARRSRWRPCPASDDTSSSSWAPQILPTELLCVLCFQFVNRFKFQPWICHRISNLIYNREALYEAGKKKNLP